MSGFGRRDPDRDRAVEVIEAAHATGRIGVQDRDLRIAQARTAASPGELEALTRDLQPAPGPGTAAQPVAQPVAQPTVVAPPRPASRPRAGVGALVALLLLAVVGAGVAGLAAFTIPTGEGESVVRPDVTRVGEPTASPLAEPVGFELTARGVQTFLRRYEARFGTLETYDAVLHPTRVRVEVPVRGSRPRAEQWSYDGSWRQDAAASAVVRPGGVVDLGAIAVRPMLANLRVATRTLGVERGEVTHVSVRRHVAGTPTVNIYVGNAVNESGYLMTTMSGEVLRRFPYEP